jgi:hypothetical protein
MASRIGSLIEAQTGSLHCGEQARWSGALHRLPDFLQAQVVAVIENESAFGALSLSIA